jgi:hypothetical protein
MSTDAAKRAHAAVEAAVEAAEHGRGTDALTDALEAVTAALGDLAATLEGSTDLRLARLPAWYARDAEAVTRDATHRHRLIAAGERDPVAYDVARLPLRVARHAVVAAAEALDRAGEEG